MLSTVCYQQGNDSSQISGSLERISADCWCVLFEYSSDMHAIFNHLHSLPGEQNVCHVGEPDYENLYIYHKKGIKSGPEQPNIAEEGEHHTEKPGIGRLSVLYVVI
jgi:hypothetical protein